MNPMMRQELERFLRHGLVPIAMIASSHGWFPEGATGDVIEAGVIAISFGVVYIWSLIKEYKRKDKEDDVTDS